ncbi:MAG: threonine synthase [Bacteroidia bacterium]|nr:threonine synthase [Bacteroidia bacterium]
MQLYSTRSPQLRVTLREAVIKGLPEDNGLYMPGHIPAFSAAGLAALRDLPFPELACRIAAQLLAGALPPADLERIVRISMTFDAPLVPLYPGHQMLELFHGPTLAFKDFGARFMAGLMGYFVQDASRMLTILVATSGDTGGAVASGFHRTPGVRVVILYPSGKVSGLQEKQLTTLGDNIQALEVGGSFDDCQALVKQAFLDPELTQRHWLTSANSINIARLIPQSFYYFRAWQQADPEAGPLVFSVPSGNFGNLTAGLLAARMGLPAAHFIAATNANDVVPAYLHSGLFQPRPSVQTLSNAMDVGNPSNFARMMDLFGGSYPAMRAAISGYAYSDAETVEAVRRLYEETGYLADPHAAVGFLAGEAYRSAHPGHQVITLGTAHPAKFADAIEARTGIPVPIPPAFAGLARREKQALPMPAEYRQFRQFLMDLPQ